MVLAGGGSLSHLQEAGGVEPAPQLHRTQQRTCCASWTGAGPTGRDRRRRGRRGREGLSALVAGARDAGQPVVLHAETASRPRPGPTVALSAYYGIPADPTTVPGLSVVDVSLRAKLAMP